MARIRSHQAIYRYLVFVSMCLCKILSLFVGSWLVPHGRYSYLYREYIGGIISFPWILLSHLVTSGGLSHIDLPFFFSSFSDRRGSLTFSYGNIGHDFLLIYILFTQHTMYLHSDINATYG